MANEPVSFVKAAIEYFSSDPHGRKLTIPEFKELNQQDKVELRDMLIAEGYNVLPLMTPASTVS